MSTLHDNLSSHLVQLYQNHVWVRQEQLTAAKNMRAAAIATDKVIQQIEAELKELGIELPTIKPTSSSRPPQRDVRP